MDKRRVIPIHFYIILIIIIVIYPYNILYQNIFPMYLIRNAQLWACPVSSMFSKHIFNV